MTISIIYYLFILFDTSYCQWKIYHSYLYMNKQFSQSTGSSAYLITDSFILPSTQTTANFITCASPPTSYITLTNTYPSAWTAPKCTINDGNWISIDLYFQGTWSSQVFKIAIGSYVYTYTYSSPSTYTLNSGFCDATLFEVKTWNFTFVIAEGTIDAFLKLTSSNSNTGQVSIRNIFVSRVKCYPSCNSCTGPKYNQCTSCYYGIQTNNICPPCPSNQYYWKEVGCRDICDLFSSLYQNGFCQKYAIQDIELSYFQSPSYDTENKKWLLIYDPQYVVTTQTITQISTMIYVYGVLKYNSGIYRYFDLLSTYAYSTYLIGLKIIILLYNDIPIDCGITFKINNTYYGSIYKTTSGVQSNKLKIASIYDYGSKSPYSTRTKIVLASLIDIPKNAFVFSAIGNYTVGTAGWGIMQVDITSGYCAQYCELCEVSFKCKTCLNGYLSYRDGSCINNCLFPYQKQNGTYCYDYDDETPYSEYLVQEFTGLEGDPEYYAKYTLIYQSGTNFLKGSDIYYSFWNGIRVFGGPFVWAQAKFQRVHNIINPHHSITIAFYILYGPSFPSDGQFIYTIESNTPVSKSTASYYYTYSDGSKYDKIYEKILHNTNTLTITWECFGPNNEPIKAYCGYYNYYIASHKTIQNRRNSFRSIVLWWISNQNPQTQH
ncbi:unnamed protein product [Paramecium octaurelia]|uniref:Uncharacterized protein n=1 Tax=Paramecium octaurelia TaxID=43137 RepID=A0A8S1WKE5_PAROT|nr:unnamed protein product [Paramecium octaurelia]